MVLTTLLIRQAQAGVTTGNNVAFGNTAAGTAVVMTGNALIGTNLANDHPISVVYLTTAASPQGKDNSAYKLDRRRNNKQPARQRQYGVLKLSCCSRSRKHFVLESS